MVLWCWLALCAGLAATLTACDSSPKPQFYKGVTLQSDVYYASTRRWNLISFFEQSIDWLHQTGEEVTFHKAPKNLQRLRVGKEVTIFIHGFRGTGKTVARYFGGLISHLKKEAGYKPLTIVYDWLSVAPVGRKEPSRAGSSRLRAPW